MSFEVGTVSSSSSPSALWSVTLTLAMVSSLLEMESLSMVASRRVAPLGSGSRHLSPCRHVSDKQKCLINTLQHGFLSFLFFNNNNNNDKIKF